MAERRLSISHSRTDNMGERDEPKQSELDQYGIERVPADVFLWAGYRYSHAHDALAAAKRGAKA
jgi:formate-dependent nitrite reductase cytochrome c552 subunit